MHEGKPNDRPLCFPPHLQRVGRVNRRRIPRDLPPSVVRLHGPKDLGRIRRHPQSGITRSPGVTTAGRSRGGAPMYLRCLSTAWHNQATPSSAARRELEVVKRSNRLNGEVTIEEEDRIRAHVVRDMLRPWRALKGDPVHDISRDWLLEGRRKGGLLVKNPEHGYREGNKDAGSPEPFAERFRLATSGDHGRTRIRTTLLVVRLLFLVNHDIVGRLVEADWELFYELFMLTVRRLAWADAQPRDSRSGRVGAN